MTREEMLAYQRGYNKGAHRRWPAHVPPLPVDSPLVADLMRALSDLCDTADGQLAQFGSGDPMAEMIYPKIDRARAAMAEITKKLTASL